MVSNFSERKKRADILWLSTDHFRLFLKINFVGKIIWSKWGQNLIQGERPIFFQRGGISQNTVKIIFSRILRTGKFTRTKQDCPYQGKVMSVPTAVYYRTQAFWFQIFFKFFEKLVIFLNILFYFSTLYSGCMW